MKRITKIAVSMVAGILALTIIGILLMTRSEAHRLITAPMETRSPRPVFLMQGGADVVISADSGQRLYNAAGEPKELWFEPSLGHVAFDTEMPDEFERRVVGFFNRYLLHP